jgi:cob(I)alamin adenosyltransferase
MVRLTKIYTKTGDNGTTGLATGERVPKHDLRVEAYGTVDEANAAIGVAVLACGERTQLHEELRAVLVPIQHDLFDVGADLATPFGASEAPGTKLRIIQSQIDRLERTIDHFNESLAPLTSFVLPGGTPLSAHLHVARTVVRRAERIACALLDSRPTEVSPLAMVYLNRLSDLLFVLGRVANDHGKHDVLWKPGSTRQATSAHS